jgi:hypothetical protein
MKKILFTSIVLLSSIFGFEEFKKGDNEFPGYLMSYDPIEERISGRNRAHIDGSPSLQFSI